MELTRAIAISVIAASLGLAAGVHAQSLTNVDTPNEFPPASYKGKQYVDSKGCVYIRAGVDGNVTWVPRMTRDRKVLCGYKPTPVAGSTNTTPAPALDKNVVVIQPAAKPTASPIDAITQPKSTAAAPSAKPKPATTATVTPVKPASTTTTATTKPKSNSGSFWNWPSTPKKSTTTSAAPATTPPPAAPAPVATAPTTTTTTTTKQPRRTLDTTPRQSGYDSPCRGGTGSNKSVRCGPQADLPYTPGTGNPTAKPPRIIYKRQGASLGVPNGSAYVATRGMVVKEGEVGPNVRVVPRHVYENRRHAQGQAQVPPGFRRVFDDGRLNPHRAEMTFAGKASMDAIWQETVPRILNNPPYEGVGVVSSQSTVSTRSSAAAPAAAPVVSTKSAPAEKSIRLSGQSYVQIATYRDKSQAQSTARNLRGQGATVKIGKYDRNGQTYRMVLAGPFPSQASAEKAAAKARQSGYADAFVRN